MPPKQKGKAAPKAPTLKTYLDEDSASSSDEYYSQQENSSQKTRSRNATRSESRSPQRRSNRNESNVLPQRERANSNQNLNQAGSSKAQSSAAASTSKKPDKAVGASKRKALPKKSTAFHGKALQQIRYLQTTTDNLIPRMPFCRLLKEIIQSHGDYRITKDCVDALQHAMEAYLVGIFNDAYRLTLHRDRVTIAPKDIQLLLYIRGGQDPGVP